MAGPCDSFYYQNPGSGQTFLCHEPPSGGACVSTNVFYCPPPSPPPPLPPSSPLDYAVFLERIQSLPSLFMHFADAPFRRSSWVVLLAETGFFGLLLFCACQVGCRAGASLARPRERRHDRLVDSLVEGTEGWWADEDPPPPDPPPPPPDGPRVRQVWLTKTASGVGLNISEDGEVLLVTSPAAEAAGVLVGDRVVAVNGCAADTLPAIAQVLRSAAVGQPAALSLRPSIGADHWPTPVEPLLAAPPDSAAESAPPPQPPTKTTTDPPRADEESTEMFLRLAKAASERHGMRVRSRSANMYISHVERAKEGAAAARDRFALGGEKLPLAAGLEGEALREEEAAKGASSPPRRQVDARLGAEEATGRAAAKKGEAEAETAASAAEAAVDAVAARVAAQAAVAEAAMAEAAAAEAAADAVAARVAAQAAVAEAAMAEAAADTEVARVAAQAAVAAAGAAKARGGVAITVARRTSRRSIAEVIERRLTGNASPLQLHSPISTPPGSRPTSPPPVQVDEIRAEIVRSVRGLRSSSEPEVSPPAAAEPEAPDRAQQQGAEVEQQTQGAVAEAARVARPEAEVQRLQEVVEAEARARTDTREGCRGNVSASTLLYVADGNVYEGEYNAAGEAEGRGVMQYAGGDVYDGEWKAGMPEGRGVFRYADGDVYDGEFKAGEREGRGVFRYADGDVESGFYKQGADVGEGVRWKADGRRAERLRDGEEEEEISLEEARQTTERLGLLLPSPLPGA